MQRYRGLNGEVLPDTNAPNWLLIEHVLQRYRDVWTVIDTYPFLAVDIARLEARCDETSEFAVFANGRMMQNVRPDEGGKRILSSFFGGGTDAGMSPAAEIMVEGTANPLANWIVYFNDPFMIGMHPFATLGTHYIYVEGNSRYQRTFGELIIVSKHSRPSSQHADFNPLADLAHTFHYQYISGPRDQRDLTDLPALIDAIFVENQKILTAAAAHHRALAPHEKPFEYMAPTLTHYGRLTHDANRIPRIELSFALLHYEKALREFDDLKTAAAKRDVDSALFHGVYCVVAIAACIEAIANKLVYQETGAHPDHRDKRQPLQKLNDAAFSIAKNTGKAFAPLTAGDPAYDALDRVRELRNAFMHAKERDEAIDPVALTSIVATELDEEHCRSFLRQLRQGVANVYDQLTGLAAPIVTREDVKWFGTLEVP
tara:strand:+ start:158 stop:1444 length:1287 start_codon:yes stop_codon:yes gene_type:complete